MQNISTSRCIENCSSHSLQRTDQLCAQAIYVKGDHSQMMILSRVLALLVVMPATYYFVYWVPFSLVPFIEQRWIPSLISFLVAAGVGWYTWRILKSTPKGPVTNILLGAIVLGSIGFCAGFFGPIIFAPQANQGPMLGIFITGPLGFILGGVGGLAYWLVKGKKKVGNEAA